MAEKKPRIKVEGYLEDCRKVGGTSAKGPWEMVSIKVGDTEMTTFDADLQDVALGIPSGSWVTAEWYESGKYKRLDSISASPAPARMKKPAGLVESGVPGVTPYQVVQQRGYLHKDAIYAATRIMDIRVQALALKVEVRKQAGNQIVEEQIDRILDACTSDGFLGLAGKLQKALEADVFRDMAENPVTADEEPQHGTGESATSTQHERRETAKEIINKAERQPGDEPVQPFIPGTDDDPPF